jgi:aminotransferase in exopolysaccharide biosynthesis
MMDEFDKIISFIRNFYPEREIIPLHAPVFRGNEKKYLAACVDSTFVSSVGKFVDMFEERMAEYTGAKKTVVCVNGTSALHLALKLIGVEHNHEVITQPLTFVATANAISYCDAYPVFLDVDMDTLGLSPKSLLQFLEKQTYYNKTTNQPINKSTNRPISACLPMHTFGHPCRIDEIIEVCRRFGIPVMEDAAESTGSYFKGQHTGTFGDIGVLSFNGNKILTTGGGGMLLFRDELLAEKAKHLSTQAKISHNWEIAHDETGYNYRMPNINAALGLAQLEQLEGFLLSKRQLAAQYKDFFEQLNIPFITEPTNSKSNYWLNAILFPGVKEKVDFLKYSNERGILTRPAWQLMNKLPMFRECQTDQLVNANYLADRLVNIPSSVP